MVFSVFSFIWSCPLFTIFRSFQEEHYSIKKLLLLPSNLRDGSLLLLYCNLKLSCFVNVQYEDILENYCVYINFLLNNFLNNTIEGPRAELHFTLTVGDRYT